MSYYSTGHLSPNRSTDSLSARKKLNKRGSLSRIHHSAAPTGLRRLFSKKIIPEKVEGEEQPSSRKGCPNDIGNPYELDESSVPDGENRFLSNNIPYPNLPPGRPGLFKRSLSTKSTVKVTRERGLPKENGVCSRSGSNSLSISITSMVQLQAPRKSRFKELFHISMPSRTYGSSPSLFSECSTVAGGKPLPSYGVYSGRLINGIPFLDGYADDEDFPDFSSFSFSLGGTTVASLQLGDSDPPLLRKEHDQGYNMFNFTSALAGVDEVGNAKPTTSTDKKDDFEYGSQTIPLLLVEDVDTLECYLIKQVYSETESSRRSSELLNTSLRQDEIESFQFRITGGESSPDVSNITTPEKVDGLTATKTAKMYALISQSVEDCHERLPQGTGRISLDIDPIEEFQFEPSLENCEENETMSLYYRQQYGPLENCISTFPSSVDTNEWLGPAEEEETPKNQDPTLEGSIASFIFSLDQSDSLQQVEKRIMPDGPRLKRAAFEDYRSVDDKAECRLALKSDQSPINNTVNVAVNAGDERGGFVFGLAERREGLEAISESKLALKRSSSTPECVISSEYIPKEDEGNEGLLSSATDALMEVTGIPLDKAEEETTVQLLQQGPLTKSTVALQDTFTSSVKSTLNTFDWDHDSIAPDELVYEIPDLVQGSTFQKSPTRALPVSTLSAFSFSDYSFDEDSLPPDIQSPPPRSPEIQHNSDFSTWTFESAKEDSSQASDSKVVQKMHRKQEANPNPNPRDILKFSSKTNDYARQLPRRNFSSPLDPFPRSSNQSLTTSSFNMRSKDSIMHAPPAVSPALRHLGVEESISPFDAVPSDLQFTPSDDKAKDLSTSFASFRFGNDKSKFSSGSQLACPSPASSAFEHFGNYSFGTSSSAHHGMEGRFYEEDPYSDLAPSIALFSASIPFKGSRGPRPPPTTWLAVSERIVEHTLRENTNGKDDKTEGSSAVEFVPTFRQRILTASGEEVPELGPVQEEEEETMIEQWYIKVLRIVLCTNEVTADLIEPKVKGLKAVEIVEEEEQKEEHQSRWERTKARMRRRRGAIEIA